MEKRKIEAIIEGTASGFGIFSNELPGITGYGKTIDVAKEDFRSALEDTIMAYGDEVPEDLKGRIELVFTCPSPGESGGG